MPSGSAGPVVVNLHCYPPGSVWVRRYLVFRDRPRVDETDRARYAAVARELAGRGDRPDMNSYAEAQGPTIDHIPERAGWRIELGQPGPSARRSPVSGWVTVSA